MEKPFGTDLRSARALNAVLHSTFTEEQIFRIDHFLGKEAALNILAFRFANGLFEPIWNRDHIDQVQIDVPETLAIGDRAGFYEGTGAYRDMVVTHLFQVLAFMAMEPPAALEPRAIAEEKNKVFRSMRPIEPGHVVRGQYAGYRDEPGVAPASDTETFIALRCEIDNWRWAGVPFFLRTGKNMAEGARIISIAFREPPRSMFPAGSGVGALGPDHLTFDLADAAKLSLSFYGKRPGTGMKLDKLSLQFSLQETGRQADVLEAYERLILDAMSGDHTLFNNSEGIERLWELSTPLLDAPPPVRAVCAGVMGAERHPPADRAVLVALAVRAPVAGGQCGLDIESELHHVAVAGEVVLAFEADLAQLLGLRPRADGEQLVPLDDLGTDEPALEVGVDAPGALRRRRALVERPRPRLLVAGREERAQTEQVVGAADHPEQRAFAEPEALEHLRPLGRVLDGGRLGLELHAHADDLDVVARLFAWTAELGGDARLGRGDRVELVLADVDDGEHAAVGEQEVRRQRGSLFRRQPGAVERAPVGQCGVGRLEGGHLVAE